MSSKVIWSGEPRANDSAWSKSTHRPYFWFLAVVGPLQAHPHGLRVLSPLSLQTRCMHGFHRCLESFRMKRKLDRDHRWFILFIFWEKEYINIAKILITPDICTNKMSKDIKDTHSQKTNKKHRIKSAPRWSTTSNNNTLTTTEDNTRNTKQVLQKATSSRRKQCTIVVIARSTEDLGFSSRRMSRITQKNAFNKCTELRGDW